MATDLKNPDFAAYARAFGGFGATVERTADFAEAFRAADASGLPAIVHVKVDVECMSAGRHAQRGAGGGAGRWSVRGTGGQADPVQNFCDTPT